MNLKIENASLRLYAITADGAARDSGAKARVREWLQAGVKVIQLREKNLKPSEVIAFGRFLRAMTSEYRALLIVNDDPDLAKLVDADGVHLGQEDRSVVEAREILGPRAVIGLSTHSREQVLAAANSGADYIGVGPIFASSTKSVGRPLLGAQFAGWAARESPLPVVAIGGITLENVGEIVAAGCSSVAVVSALNYDPHPAAAARAFLDLLNAADPTPPR